MMKTIKTLIDVLVLAAAALVLGAVVLESLR